MAAPYDARMIANFILDCSEATGGALTQAALLKIIYFCHGWYLAWKNVPLCSNQFEAWEYGPVVKVVRDAFRKYGRAPIRDRAQRLNVFQGTWEEIPDEISTADKLIVRKIFEHYRIYSTPKLIAMTHEKDSPWDRLWNSPEPVARLGLRIKNNEIRQHFLKQHWPVAIIH
jgi:uncharacterized phage-associated protein